MTSSTINADTILNMALVIAEDSSWQHLTFQQLASRLDTSLAILKKHFRSKDDLAEALFERADSAMLKTTEHDEYIAWDSKEKLYHCIVNWLEYLAPYKAIVKDMLQYKLEPGHFHLQAHGITRVSRTVQWFREVAQRPQRSWRVELDEIAVTSIYLVSFAFFLRDNSKDNKATKKLLRSLVNKLPNVS